MEETPISSQQPYLKDIIIHIYILKMFHQLQFLNLLSQKLQHYFKCIIFTTYDMVEIALISLIVCMSANPLCIILRRTIQCGEKVDRCFMVYRDRSHIIGEGTTGVI
jgi:hypothetical protein